MFWLYIEIYWNAVEAIFKHYWRVLTVILKKSSKSFISLKFFQFNRIENEKKNSFQRLIWKVQKPVEATFKTC
jgi:hypothetical protein